MKSLRLYDIRGRLHAPLFTLREIDSMLVPAPTPYPARKCHIARCFWFIKTYFTIYYNQIFEARAISIL